jgi:hypothetical protein
MSKARVPFIDWMKCLGMALIVAGHVAAPWVEAWTPPFNPKQLGVAFFLFAVGFSLARETRPGPRVLFNRLFEVYLFGIACALVMSAVAYARAARPSLSNYLPFLLGANVVFDAFPANPTTWYIGTYLHVLLLWALALRNWRIRPWMFLLAVPTEVLVRAAFAQTLGLYVAYMALPNWATVFLLGVYYGQRPDDAPRTNLAPYLLGLGLPVLGLGLMAVLWPLACASWPTEPSFPFRRFRIGDPLVNMGVTSAAVTFLYVGYTWLVYLVTRRLRAAALVSFFARNTLIVFIAHMPVYYAMAPVVKGVPYWARVLIWFTACFPVLAAFSEVIRRGVRPDLLRERLWLLFHKKPPPESAAEMRADQRAAPPAPEPVSSARHG